MTTLIHLATSIDALAAWVSTAWLALGELISVAGLLLALNFISNAIRRTYQAGYFCGSVWYRFAVPAILATADFISWLNSFIDWAQVRTDLIEMTKVIVAFVVAVTIEAQPTLVRQSENLGKFYSAVLVGDRAAALAPVKVTAGRCALIAGASALAICHAVVGDAAEAARTHGPRALAQAKAWMAQAKAAAIGAIDHVREVSQAFVLIVS